MRVNAHALARYAALAQEAGLVPIVEPEVLMDGAHSIELSATATGAALQAVYEELYSQRVDLAGTLLKPNMVLSGYEAAARAGADEVAERTLECLYRHVPAAVPGIVFLSGGQSDEDATIHLNAMNARGPHPWQLSFSYGRALQAPVLKAWRGDAGNAEAAQRAFLHRAHMNGEARSGAYTPELEQHRLSAAVPHVRGPTPSVRTLRSGADRNRDEHALDEVDEAVRVAPLVVVPRDDLDLRAVDDGRETGVEDRRERGAHDVARHERLLAVAEDARERAACRHAPRRSR